MINLRIRGRLGNQMFQYAFAYALLKKNNLQENINVDFSMVYKYGFKNELQHFKLERFNEVKKCYIKPFQSIMILILKLMNILRIDTKNYIKKLRKYGIIYQNDDVHIPKIDYKKNIIISGFFESPKYFDEYKKDIQNAFEPKKSPLEKNKEMYNKISSTESVCVTIRRGDFLSKEYKDKFYVCTPEYFKEAINKIKDMLNKPNFFIFSDDIEWCKNNLDFLPANSVYETGDDDVYEKLRLMYSCKHFIISNSTFSWWAQYLSKNDEKIVIAPSKWYNTEPSPCIYQDEWTLLDIDEINSNIKDF